MDRTAVVVSPDSGSKGIGFTLILWTIPILTWILLIAVYLGCAHAEMFNLRESGWFGRPERVWGVDKIHIPLEETLLDSLDEGEEN